MRKNIIIGILLLAAVGGLQAQTNQGTDFWLAETSNELTNSSVFAIAIANPNAVAANAVIDHDTDAPVNVVIPPGGLVTTTKPRRDIWPR